MTDLSILIPARNERFLENTVQDILKNMRGDTEIIVVLDGQWADPHLPQHERLNVIYMPESIGQRAAVNTAARVSRAKYLMKVDAHCAFDEGFDVKMIAEMQPNWCMVPVMRNLHVFDWVCEDGHRRYQSPSGPCNNCDKPTHMEIVWNAKTNPQSVSYCFDPEPHFQYFNEFKHRPEGKGDITETMSLQGSCFMMTREMYFDLNVCDESWGSWGSQGIEVACKVWLSGGKVMVNHKTWYAHCFRTQGGDFGFPYPLSGSQVRFAKKTAHEIFFTDSWEKQVRPLSWLVKRFWPVPHWTEQDLEKLPKELSKIDIPNVNVSHATKGVVYYTNNQLDPDIMQMCQSQLKNSVNGNPIVAVSLKQTLFTPRNIVLPLESGYLTMFQQILTGIEALDTDYVFLAEHDILYHPSHFEFTPPQDDIYYYNLNCWKLRWSDKHALYYITKQTSQLCANRELLRKHYKERVRRTTEALISLDEREYKRFIRRQGFEPGSHGRKERVDDFKSDTWKSATPNIDIRHNQNLTPNRWRRDQFRDQRNCRDWQEADSVPGWGGFLFDE